MKTATFQYKCRMCGETFNGGQTGKDWALGHIIAAMNQAELPGGGTVKILTPHYCEDNKVGVADLLGYVVKD